MPRGRAGGRGLFAGLTPSLVEVFQGTAVMSPSSLRLCVTEQVRSGSNGRDKLQHHKPVGDPISQFDDGDSGSY